MSVFSKDISYQFSSTKGFTFYSRADTKHLVWHFESQDLYIISDLPSDYWEYLDHMGLEIKKLSVCLEQTLEVEN